MRAGVPVDDAGLRRAYHKVEPALLGEELGFVALLPRDIGVGADQPDHFAVGIAHHRLADDHPLRRAVGPGAQRLDLAHPLALRKQAHVLGVIALRFLLREELQHAASDGAFTRHPDHLQPGVVDRDVAPLPVLEIHGARALVDHLARQHHLVAQAFPLLRQRPLDFVFLGDIEARRDHAARHALRIDHHGARLKVMPAAQRELGEVEGCPRAALERDPVSREHAVRLLFRQAFLRGPADHVFARGAEAFLPGAVDEEVLPLCVAHGQREWQRIEDLVGEFRLMRDLGLRALQLGDVGARAYQPEHAAVLAGQHRLADDAPLRHVARPLMHRLDRRGGSALREELRIFGSEAFGGRLRIDLSHGMAERALGGNAAHLRPASVDEREASLLVLDEDRVRDLLDDRLRQRALLAQRLLVARLLLGKLAFALLQFGDVAGGANHAHRAALLVARGETVGARPAPRAVLGAETVVAFEACGIALQVRDRRCAKAGEVLGVDARTPVAERLERPGGQAKRAMHALQELDAIGGDVPVEGAFVDRAHDGFVALLHFAQAAPGFGETLA